MQTFVSPSSEVGPGSVPASPSCPTCKLEMRFVQATSIAFTPHLVDVSYICDECGRGTKRTLKENLKSSS
jgi:C4-type Zn-finger protein